MDFDAVPGQPYPLGATAFEGGTNFSVFSGAAHSVQLCLFHPRSDGGYDEQRIEVEEVDGSVWHIRLVGVGPGQRYGWRVAGEWNPPDGQRCNPNKLLLDPYAKAVDGLIDWDEACFPYLFGEPDSRNDMDSGDHVSKAVVIDSTFDWRGDTPLRTPLHQSVIYEVHVKGFTQTHPDIPSEMRGTYAGLAHPAPVQHLKALGVTAVELMPVHQFVHDHHLREQGLRNYWGYNSLAFLAPHNEYASAPSPADAVTEFKAMVRDLHEAGLEVILDVVYNHTAEGNHMGPVLSMKGIDNTAYYRVMANDKRYYMDYTGTGNTLNMQEPHVLQLIMDSLRYWILEMHVDGFRFDLASTLARELHAVDRLSAFFDIIQQDPVISQVKLIAEPWDIGEGGYQVGRFPPLWSEWNGQYRDEIRDVWRSQPGTVGALAERLAGSSDLYANDNRRPTASVNFVTAHDGFTLADLVSYNEKHNAANGEDGRDGSDDNRSWNGGVEGPTKDPAIQQLRRRQQRNILATLFLSQGIPMLLGGDELGRTQGGNNNGYAQDNEISWFDWDSVDDGLLAFTRALISFRADHPVFSRRRWFQGVEIWNQANWETSDISWFTPTGSLMDSEDWNSQAGAQIAMFLNGSEIPTPAPDGSNVTDDSFLVIVNAHHEPIKWVLPTVIDSGKWQTEIDTDAAAASLVSSVSDPLGSLAESIKAGSTLGLKDRSLTVLRHLR